MPIRSIIMFLLSLLVSGLFAACQASSSPESKPQALTDRERDGLSGAVKAVLTDDVILAEENGQWFETQQASSVSVYDQTGKRILQTPFRISLPGGYAITEHELLFESGKKGTIEDSNAADKPYTEYDSKGNVIEKGRRDEKGKRAEASIKYEFDAAGNWIKRVISRLVQKNGQPALLPAEASYRQIVYVNSSPPSSEKSPEFVPADAKQLKSPLPANEANISAGRSLFNQKCAACHGDDGKAQTPFASVMPVKPEDLTGDEIRQLTEGAIYQFASDGIKAAGMPGLKGRIRDEALWQIALYVRQLSRSQPPADRSTIAGSSPTPSPRANAAPPTVAEQRYPFKGKVISVDRQTQHAIIEHENIPGYMEAMTMPFPIKNEKVLNALKKDDRIQAILVVDSNGWRLENVAIK